MRCAIVVSGCSAGEATRSPCDERKRTSEEMHRATARIPRGDGGARGGGGGGGEGARGWRRAASYTFPESRDSPSRCWRTRALWLRLLPRRVPRAILNAQPMGFYPVSTLIHDAKAHGVEVRPRIFR